MVERKAFLLRLDPAVWTALVMECVFGPGPVAQSEGCAGGAGEVVPATAGRTVREDPLPVFLASGASGGSVGLTVWSAHRVDLAGGGAVAARTPKRVEAALGADFVAPELARMLSGDLLHLLLAHHLPDRATVMESAWGTQVEDGCRLLVSPVNFHVSAPGHTPPRHTGG